MRPQQAFWKPCEPLCQTEPDGFHPSVGGAGQRACPNWRDIRPHEAAGSSHRVDGCKRLS
jgi:hypothetical protein